MGFGASLLDYTGHSIYIGAAAAATAAVMEWEDQPFKHKADRGDCLTKDRIFITNTD